MLPVCQTVFANFDRLHNMRMTTDYVIYSFSKQPIGQKLLFFVRE